MSADRELAARLARGDQRALAALYDRLSSRVYGLALSMLGDGAEAEEVVSDAFLQAWRTAAEYDAARGSLDGWVITIARSRALDRLRGTRRRQRIRAGEEHKIASFTISEPGPDPDTLTETRLTMTRSVTPALAELADEQRRVIELAYLGGRTHSEIAAELGVPLGTVKTRLRVGMQRLRAALEGGPVDPGAPTERAGAHEGGVP